MVDFDTVLPVPALLSKILTHDNIVLIAAAQNPIRRFRVAWQIVLPNVFYILTAIQRRPEKTCHVAAAQEPQSYTDLLNTEAHARPYVTAFVEQAAEPIAVARPCF